MAGSYCIRVDGLDLFALVEASGHREFINARAGLVVAEVHFIAHFIDPMISQIDKVGDKVKRQSGAGLLAAACATATKHDPAPSR